MTEETFVRELERRADHVRGVPLSLADVRRRARSIQRRRRATAAAAVAAAVAVVAVVPAVLSGRLDRADGPQPAPTPTTSAHTAVLHDGTVRLPDGSKVDVDLDNADVVDFGVLDDGRIVVALQKPYVVRVYAANGTLAEQYPVQSNVITMSPRDDLAAWMGEDFRVRVLESGVEEPAVLNGIPMPGEAAGSVDAVLGSDCASGGCRVLGGDFATTGFEVTRAPTTELDTSVRLHIDDVSPDGSLWAVSLPEERSDAQYYCSGLYDPDADEVVARSCDTSSLQFAPDGKHLLGARGDNNTYGEVTVLDDDLEVVGSYTPPHGRVVSRFAWADESHLLVAIAGLDDRQWSLVRVGLDGDDPEVVAGPVDGRSPEMLSEYLLSE